MKNDIFIKKTIRIKKYLKNGWSCEWTGTGRGEEESRAGTVFVRLNQYFSLKISATYVREIHVT